jgi:DnaK suppressor protein
MTQKQLIAHRTALSQKRAELKSSLALHANTKILAGDRLTDSLDQSAHALETVVQVRLRENQSRLLRAIEAALDRIDRGTFGDCESCRQSIPAVRLSAVPWARMCRECKEQQDSELAPRISIRQSPLTLRTSSPVRSTNP